MKYLHIMVTIIAILLLSIGLKLINLQAQMTIVHQKNQVIIDSNQYLQQTIVQLTKKIDKLNTGSLENN